MTITKKKSFLGLLFLLVLLVGVSVFSTNSKAASVSLLKNSTLTSDYTDQQLDLTLTGQTGLEISLLTSQYVGFKVDDNLKALLSDQTVADSLKIDYSVPTLLGNRTGVVTTLKVDPATGIVSGRIPFNLLNIAIGQKATYHLSSNIKLPAGSYNFEAIAADTPIDLPLLGSNGAKASITVLPTKTPIEFFVGTTTEGTTYVTFSNAIPDTFISFFPSEGGGKKTEANEDGVGKVTFNEKLTAGSTIAVTVREPDGTVYEETLVVPAEEF
ncbi:hypothetical protein HCJ66_01425 [Listeria sp. FSL L7-1582]|uniref:hypothetical protein n=1 Tax=Listeria portnoyi TaxID=2713504 RepID=UPI00164E7253|nr:hypothetical protein [Listeria portnoyi]MBC6308204.1 hypothetical protein [Listeria portnoyi]